MKTNKLEITTPNDREVVVTRTFNAPRARVYDALMQPPLVRQWLLGPPGWEMPECHIDARPGGAYRYVWQNAADGRTFGMGGAFEELVPNERIVATEKFDEPWYPGDAHVTQTLAESAGETTLTITVRYDSREARDGVLNAGMSNGMAASYDRLAALIES